MPAQSEHPDQTLARRSFLALGAGAALAATSALTLASPAAAAPATETAKVTKTPNQAPPPATHTAGQPDFGPNVHVFDSSTANIQATLDAIYAQQRGSQFGEGRYALLFKPGAYSVDVKLGYYTQVAGLGLQPSGASITGSLGVEGDAHGNGTLVNFWRGAENLNAVPKSGVDTWAVSQATYYRRIYLLGDLKLSDGGYSSGGFIADCQLTGQVNSGTQQQWLTRNSVVGSWVGSNWNFVFVGSPGAPATSFPTPPYTSVERTPMICEKPFLYVDGAGAYQVFVPAVRTDAEATSWEARKPEGTSLPIDAFHIAKPTESAADLNAALAQGKHLLLTPGIYHVDQPLTVTRADTVVLGLGYATLIPDNGVTALDVADVDGVRVAGLLVDAGPVASDPLIRFGPDGSRRGHARNPSSMHDVFVRVGGAGVGKAKRCVVVNSDDVLIDNMWLWRADHGAGVGWDANTSDVGLVVNGSGVIAYGLFVEHHQKAQVQWNGEGGRTYFFQNEMPYDPPNQAAWMDGTHRGFPAYAVGDNVRTHEAWGLGSYCIFSRDRTIVSDRAISAPHRPGVRFHSMITFSLGGGQGTIAHVVNDTGGPSDAVTGLAMLKSYP
ncbi:coagulation factor 5/8 type domain-containing protein [Amycolatopsis sp. NPDC050768]|uniref:coagulation factor 5/8 type domain-containing protein n=1 Tax=Amycolatopsis sp. NPDC050768 TaxID=3154839 RepID=UPI0034033316